MTITTFIVSDVPVLFGLFLGSFGLGLVSGLLLLYFKKAAGLVG